MITVDYNTGYDTVKSMEVENAVRYFIDETGNLLLINADESVVTAFAARVWRRVYEL